MLWPHLACRECNQSRLLPWSPIAPAAVLALLMCFATACARGVQSGGAILDGTLIDQGVERHYTLYRPGSLREDTRPPLLLLFHGGHGQGSRLSRRLGMNEIAEREGFVVAYPDAVEGHWNDGRGSTATGIDDVAFVSHLIDELREEQGIDASRVYAAGISNGGSFSARLACELSGRIAAIAQVVSTMSRELRASCAPERAIPVLLINGVDDPLVPWKGGELRKSGRLGKGGTVISAADAIEFWVTHNGCEVAPRIDTLADRDPGDGTRVEQTRYEDCSNGTSVELLAIRGGGHTWPGTAERPRLSRIVGGTSQDINASEVLWQFVSRYRLE
jgi:polyhydroxybutyrate depolymerase